MLLNNLARSATFRLAMIYMVLFGFSVAILLGFIYWSTTDFLTRQNDATIAAEITGLKERYELTGLRGLSSLIAERSQADGDSSSSVYLLADEKQAHLVGNLALWPNVEPDDEGWLNFTLESASPDQAELPARARHFILRGRYNLLVGRDLKSLAQFKRATVNTLVWGLAVTLTLGIIGGLVMSRSMTRRVEIINQTSRKIIGGDLSNRIPDLGGGSEFTDLASNLNAMLSRIETLMDDVRRVSDNIAHDLKTPLARLRNRLETLAVRQNTEEAHRALEDADQLLSTFNSLLKIARVESSARRADFGPVNLGEVVESAVDLYQPLAEDKGLNFVSEIDETAFMVNGDRNLLSQAITNLLDNAVKYTDDGTISVSVDASSGALQVSDSGPGIGAADRAQVFKRFYRVESSRTSPGNGLGLSLVKAVIDVHGATLTLDDNQPGLRVTVGFPKPPRRSEPAGGTVISSTGSSAG